MRSDARAFRSGLGPPPAPAPPAGPASPREVFLDAAGIVLLGVLVYWPALRGPFLWDDLAEIPRNPALRGPHALARIWSGQAGPDYFPVKTTLQWIFHHAWGDNPLPYHCLSLGLHLLAALLFWRLLRRLGVRFAHVGALLFALHPLAVESVAWIAEFKNVLSEVFLLAAMIAYVGYDKSSRRSPAPGAHARPLYILSLVRFTLALLSKSTVAMFPFVILLHAWWRRGRIDRRDLLSSAPFFAVSFALGLVTVSFQYHRALSQWTIPLHGLGPHLAVAGLAIAFYLYKSVLPFDLHPLYRPWDVSPPSALQFLPWLGLILLLAWLWTKRASWGRHALFGLGFFLINLVPVLGFAPMSYMHLGWVADHFGYLPLLGIVGLAAAGLGRILPRSAEERKLTSPRSIGQFSLVLIVAILCALTRVGASNFSSEERLWNHVLAENPGAWMADIDLGRSRAQAGDYLGAAELYGKALAIRSDLPEAYYNRGAAYARLGRDAEAMADYRRAIQLQPDSPDALMNLGNLLVRSARTEEAIADYRAALRVQPDAPDIRANLSRALLSQVRDLAMAGRLPEAAAAAEEALRLDPASAEAHADLGNLLLMQHRLPEAAEQYEAALRIDPGNAGIGQNLARVRQALQAAGR